MSGDRHEWTENVDLIDDDPRGRKKHAFLRQPHRRVRLAVDIFLIEQLESPLADVERHLLPVLDMGNNETKPLESRAHLRRLGHELFIPLGVERRLHRSRRAFMRHDQRRRRENKVTRCVIAVGLGIDQVAHRERRKLFHGGKYRPRIRRVVAAVDQHHAFLGNDDAAIGVEISPDVDVNPVGDLANIRAEILCLCPAGA